MYYFDIYCGPIKNKPIKQYQPTKIHNKKKHITYVKEDKSKK